MRILDTEHLMFYNPWLPQHTNQRNLSHWHQAGATYFITFRLADSIPLQKLRSWKAERELWITQNGGRLDEKQLADYEKRFPAQLNKWLDAGSGCCVLKKPAICQILCNALKYFNGTRYTLDRWVIMPNHVHLLITPNASEELSKILHSLKSFTSNQINKSLRRTGVLWQDESYDRIVRSPEELSHFRLYIEANPSNAGITLPQNAQG
jgi:REP element-mobilizing transposase RayT